MMKMMMVATGTDPSTFAYTPDGTIPGYHPHHPTMMMRAPPPPLCPPLMRYMSSSGYSFNSTDAVALLPFPHLAYAQSFGVHGIFGGPSSHYNNQQQKQQHDYQHTTMTTTNGTSTGNLNHQQHRQLLSGFDLIAQPPPQLSSFARSATTAASFASSSSYATPTALYHQQQQQQHKRTGSSTSNTTAGSSDLDIAVRALLDLTPSVEESLVAVPSSTTVPTITNAHNENHDSLQDELDSEKERATAAAAIFSQQSTLALAHDHHHEQQHGRPVATTAKPFTLVQKNIIKPPPANGGVATTKNKNWLVDDESAPAEQKKRRKIGPHIDHNDRMAKTNFTIIVPPGPATTFQAQDNSKPTSSLFEEIAALLQHPPTAHIKNERNTTATKEENYNDFPDELALMLQSNESLARNALQLIEESVETDVACKCKNTKCLKLYCSCFQNGKLCSTALCKCNGCSNTVEHSIAGGSRTKAIFDTLKRRPDAFDKRLRKKTGGGCFCKKTRYVSSRGCFHESSLSSDLAPSHLLACCCLQLPAQVL
jgi:hypothetical protein